MKHFIYPLEHSNTNWSTLLKPLKHSIYPMKHYLPTEVHCLTIDARHWSTLSNHWNTLFSQWITLSTLLNPLKHSLATEALYLATEALSSHWSTLSSHWSTLSSHWSTLCSQWSTLSSHWSTLKRDITRQPRWVRHSAATSTPASLSLPLADPEGTPREKYQLSGHHAGLALARPRFRSRKLARTTRTGAKTRRRTNRFPRFLITQLMSVWSRRCDSPCYDRLLPACPPRNHIDGNLFLIVY